MDAPKPGRLSIETSLLFICDIQENERLNKQIVGFDSVLDTAAFMLEIAEKLKLTTVVTEHNPKVFGSLHSVLKTIADKLPIEILHTSEKTIFSMITNEVDSFLSKYPEKKKALVLGIETHVCVQQTCLDLREKGYDVFLLTDGVSSRRLVDRSTALQRLIQSGVYLTTSESAVFELLKDSKHPNFKEVLQIIKKERFSPF